MKVGYIQFEPILGDLDATLNYLEVLLRDSAEADLIVLPELCNSGYNFISYQQAIDTAEEVQDSHFIRFLEEHSKKNDQWIAAGFNGPVAADNERTGPAKPPGGEQHDPDHHDDHQNRPQPVLLPARTVLFHGCSSPKHCGHGVHWACQGILTRSRCPTY